MSARFPRAGLVRDEDARKDGSHACRCALRVQYVREEVLPQGSPQTPPPHPRAGEAIQVSTLHVQVSSCNCLPCQVFYYISLLIMVQSSILLYFTANKGTVKYFIIFHC